MAGTPVSTSEDRVPHVQNDMCTGIFAAELLIIAKNGNQSQCALGGDQPNSFRLSHTRDYSPAIKENEVALFVVIRKNFQDLLKWE